MTLASSGYMSFGGLGGTDPTHSLNKELGNAYNAQNNLGGTSLRTLAGVSSGPISLAASFYGKSNYTPSLRINQITAQFGTVFTVPAGTPSGTTYTYLLIGGGGPSGSKTSGVSNASTPGGGAGQVQTGTFTVSAGQTITFTVGGSGASSSFTTTGPGTVTSVQGQSGTSGATGGQSGNSLAGSVGGITYAGAGGGSTSAGTGGNLTISQGGAGQNVTIGGTVYNCGGGGGGGAVYDHDGVLGNSTDGGGQGGSADAAGLGGVFYGDAGTAGTGGGGGGGARVNPGFSAPINQTAGGTGRLVVYG
jgi:hypothetical protein